MKNLIKTFVVLSLFNLNSLNAAEARAGASKATAEQIASFEQQLDAQIAALEQPLETIKIFHDQKTFIIVVLAKYGSNKIKHIMGKNIHKKVSIFEIEAYSKQDNLPLTSIGVALHPINPLLQPTTYYALIKREFFDLFYKEKMIKTLNFIPGIDAANRLRLYFCELSSNNVQTNN